jgi:alkanesulfonate monooxygenase SsuD/methylene tetrahydromethanopterin reductase-like flavin-dependent oxidoreductase (luciferase family)
VRFALSMFGYTPRTEKPAEAYRRARVLADLADELDFDGVGSGQHWLTGGDYALAPLPLMAAVAADHPRLWISVTEILPLVQPVRLAEELATLDTIAGGRVVLTAVLGYAEREFDAFGVPRRERGARFEEICSVLRALWAGQPVAHSGRYPLRDAVISLPPAQPDGIPIWVGADASAGLRRVAQCGDAWAAATHLDLAELRAKVGELRELRAERAADGRALGSAEPLSGDAVTRGPARQPLARIAYVAADRATAIADVLPYLRRRGEIYAGLAQAAEMDDPQAFERAYAGADLDRFLVGDPVGVAEQIVRYQRACGIDYLTLAVLLPGLEMAKIEQSIRLFTAEVMPRVREAIPV